MTEQTEHLGESKPHDVTIRTDGLGRAEITLDGNPIQSHLTGLNLDMSSASPLPEITLYLAKNKSATAFEGFARVQVADFMDDPGPAAAEFLSAIDAEELERAALNRLDLENVPGGTTAAMLRQLTEWANGRS